MARPGRSSKECRNPGLVRDPGLSLHSLRVLVGSALVKNQLCGVAMAIRYERDLGIDDLGDKIMIAFGEYFDPSLPGCLGHEMIAIPRDL